MLSDFLGIPAIQRTLDRVAYGEPITQGKGMLTRLKPDTSEAAMAVAPLVGPLGKLAMKGGKAGARLAAEQIASMAEAGSIPQRSLSQMGAIKPKGGNWLAGHVERTLAPMKRVMPEEAALTYEGIESAGRDAAMNDWLDTKLNKYIKNEMGTPDDPVRMLADKGILHVDPEALNFDMRAYDEPYYSGTSRHATTDTGKMWEGAADTTIHTDSAGNLLNESARLDANPWLAKVPPETPVHKVPVSARRDLGFNHLVDELRNATNPASGLPPELLLKYSSLNKVTVPQAVERVAKINDWRAAQQAEADAAKAMNPATFTHKEYPGDPSGMKWAQLKSKNELPEGYTGKYDGTIDPDYAGNPNPELYRTYRVFDPQGREAFNAAAADLRHATTPEAEAIRHFNEPALKDALQYEGDTMGHCVGGYCGDVASGKSQIFSLRDAKGQPHVTIEVRPSNKKTAEGIRNLPEEERQQLASEVAAERGTTPAKFNDADWDAVDQKYLSKYNISTPPPDIIQIKGKGNKAPAAQYLPYVQDFVKSGTWGDVGDLQNTGLVRKSSLKGDEAAAFADHPDEFIPQTQIQGLRDDKLLNDLNPPDDVPGYAHGGSVHVYDHNKVKSIAAKLQEEMYG
jgi:hypothetical protein